jgi:tRNA(adenine34) deaminase
MSDDSFMRLALAQAREALARGDVPVGCVVVADGRVLSAASNARERDHDPTAHAEILALREAARMRDSWRLDDATVYVTLEPCHMCAGAMVLARVARLVWGAPDPKAGAAGSLANVAQDERLNHRVEVTSGVLAGECGELLKAFFAERR